MSADISDPRSGDSSCLVSADISDPSSGDRYLSRVLSRVGG